MIRSGASATVPDSADIQEPPARSGSLAALAEHPLHGFADQRAHPSPGPTGKSEERAVLAFLEQDLSSFHGISIHHDVSLSRALLTDHTIEGAESLPDRRKRLGAGLVFLDPGQVELDGLVLALLAPGPALDQPVGGREAQQ